MLTCISRSPEETEACAAQIAPRLRPGNLLACRGGLGMGKTAFARGLARAMGLRDDVSSPTFALVHEYRQGPIPLFHFDMYRITDPDGLESTGFYDYLEQGGVLLCEWSEHIAAWLPEEALTLTFERVDDTTRRITLEGGCF